AAQDRRRRGQLVAAPDVVAGPRVHGVDPLDRWDQRARAGGDHEVAPAQLALVAVTAGHGDDARRGDAGVTAHQGHALVVQRLDVAVVVAPVGDAVAAGDRGGVGGDGVVAGQR